MYRCGGACARGTRHAHIQLDEAAANEYTQTLYEPTRTRDFTITLRRTPIPFPLYRLLLNFSYIVKLTEYFKI